MPSLLSLTPSFVTTTTDYYLPPTKSQEGHVCLSVCLSRGAPCDLYPWYIGPHHRGTPPSRTWGSHSIGTPTPRHVQTWTSLYRDRQVMFGLHCTGTPDMFKFVHYEACMVGKHLNGMFSCLKNRLLWVSNLVLKNDPSFVHQKPQPLPANISCISNMANNWQVLNP